MSRLLNKKLLNLTTAAVIFQFYKQNLLLKVLVLRIIICSPFYPLIIILSSACLIARFHCFYLFFPSLELVLSLWSSRSTLYLEPRSSPLMMALIPHFTNCFSSSLSCCCASSRRDLVLRRDHDRLVKVSQEPQIPTEPEGLARLRSFGPRQSLSALQLFDLCFNLYSPDRLIMFLLETISPWQTWSWLHLSRSCTCLETLTVHLALLDRPQPLDSEGFLSTAFFFAHSW